MIFEVFMAGLAVLAVVVMLFESFFPSYERMFELLDLFILVVFALDYFFRLFLAQNKGQFLKKNIPELVAILPFNSVFRSARLLRFLRFTKIARFANALRVALYAQRVIFRFRAFFKTNGLQYVLFATVLLIALGAYAIYAVENEYNDAVNTVGDAIWWSLVTTTTVGYGDIAPVTAQGRIVGGILMIVGIGFMGMVTATIATFFIKSAPGETLGDREIRKQVHAMLPRILELTPSELQQLRTHIQALLRE